MNGHGLTQQQGNTMKASPPKQEADQYWKRVWGKRTTIHKSMNRPQQPPRARTSYHHGARWPTKCLKNKELDSYKSWDDPNLLDEEANCPSWTSGRTSCYTMGGLLKVGWSWAPNDPQKGAIISNHLPIAANVSGLQLSNEGDTKKNRTEESRDTRAAKNPLLVEASCLSQQGQMNKTVELLFGLTKRRPISQYSIPGVMPGPENCTKSTGLWKPSHKSPWGSRSPTRRSTYHQVVHRPCWCFVPFAVRTSEPPEPGHWDDCLWIPTKNWCNCQPPSHRWQEWVRYFHSQIPSKSEASSEKSAELKRKITSAMTHHVPRW